MKNLSGPLTNAEIDRLDRFLSERINDDTDTQGKDVGVLNTSELDGFLTAIVSGPETVLPSHWMPALWGDFTPQWENEKAFERIFSLIARHMNAIAHLLIAQPEAFEPLFLEHSHGDHSHIIVDDWCAGYLRGVSLTADQWRAGDTEVMNLLAPIASFTQAPDEHTHEHADACASNHLSDAITPNVRAIHAWWLARRAPPEPQRRNEPRVGRNDPCPCGSGKKYKKCCLQ